VVKYTFTGVEYPFEEAIELEAGSNDYIQLREFPIRIRGCKYSNSLF